MLGRDSLGRGEKRWKRGGCGEQPAGTSGQNPALHQLSPQRVSVYVCEGGNCYPQPGPCPVAAQVRDSHNAYSVTPHPKCSLQGVVVLGFGEVGGGGAVHAPGHRTKVSRIPDGEISGLVRQRSSIRLHRIT